MSTKQILEIDPLNFEVRYRPEDQSLLDQAAKDLRDYIKVERDPMNARVLFEQDPVRQIFVQRIVELYSVLMPTYIAKVKAIENNSLGME